MAARGKLKERNWRKSNGDPATIDDITVFVIPILPYKQEQLGTQVEIENEQLIIQVEREYEQCLQESVDGDNLVNGTEAMEVEGKTEQLSINVTNVIGESSVETNGDLE